MRTRWRRWTKACAARSTCSRASSSPSARRIPGGRDSIRLPIPDNAFKERAIDRVLRPVGIVRANQRGGTGDRDEHAAQLPVFGVERNFRVGQPTGASHEVNDDLVRDANNGVLKHIVV